MVNESMNYSDQIYQIMNKKKRIKTFTLTTTIIDGIILLCGILILFCGIILQSGGFDALSIFSNGVTNVNPNNVTSGYSILGYFFLGGLGFLGFLIGIVFIFAGIITTLLFLFAVINGIKVIRAFSRCNLVVLKNKIIKDNIYKLITNGLFCFMTVFYVISEDSQPLQLLFAIPYIAVLILCISNLHTVKNIII